MIYIDVAQIMCFRFFNCVCSIFTPDKMSKIATRIRDGASQFNRSFTQLENISTTI